MKNTDIIQYGEMNGLEMDIRWEGLSEGRMVISVFINEQEFKVTKDEPKFMSSDLTIDTERHWREKAQLVGEAFIEIGEMIKKQAIDGKSMIINPESSSRVVHF